MLHDALKTTPADGRAVCIIGNLNMDLIIRRVPALPAWGQEVNGLSHTLVPSGQAGYLAFALGRLGVPTSVIGAAGDDAFGAQIVDELRRFRVNASGVALLPGGQTGITVGIVRPDGERAFVSNLASSRDFDEAMVLHHWSPVEAASVVCLVGTFCTPALTLPVCARLLDKARAAGKITMLDTGWDPQGWQPDTLAAFRPLLAQVSLFMPNLDEARALTHEETPAAAAEALQALGPEWVVIKCGAQGSYARWGTESAFAPPRPVTVFDAVGAGDVFNSGFLYGLLHDWPLPACLAFGNTISSLYISRPAERFPVLSEVALTARAAYPYVPDVLIP